MGASGRSGSWMRLVVNPFQAFGRHVRVHLRRREMRVPEEFLYTPQIGAGVQEMRGETVPEFVRGERGVQSRRGEVAL